MFIDKDHPFAVQKRRTKQPGPVADIINVAIDSPSTYCVPLSVQRLSVETGTGDRGVGIVYSMSEDKRRKKEKKGVQQ